MCPEVLALDFCEDDRPLGFEMVAVLRATLLPLILAGCLAPATPVDFCVSERRDTDLLGCLSRDEADWARDFEDAERSKRRARLGVADSGDGQNG